eukprot:351591-Chlamydomonas_euryale.AAC.3
MLAPPLEGWVRGRPTAAWIFTSMPTVVLTTSGNDIRLHKGRRASMRVWGRREGRYWRLSYAHVYAAHSGINPRPDQEAPLLFGTCYWLLTHASPIPRYPRVLPFHPCVTLSPVCHPFTLVHPEAWLVAAPGLLSGFHPEAWLVAAPGLLSGFMRRPCRLSLIACFVAHRHTQSGLLPETLTVTPTLTLAAGRACNCKRMFTTTTG